jgi:hypothetical protein
MVKFQERVIQTMEQIALETGKAVNGEDTLDETLHQRAITEPNIERAVDELHAILDQALPILVQTNWARREGAEAKIGSLVDSTTYNKEKRGKCKKTKVSANKGEQ